MAKYGANEWYWHFYYMQQNTLDLVDLFFLFRISRLSMYHYELKNAIHLHLSRQMCTNQLINGATNTCQLPLLNCPYAIYVWVWLYKYTCRLVDIDCRIYCISIRCNYNLSTYKYTQCSTNQPNKKTHENLYT